MITRSDYMKNTNLHQAYYLQMAQNAGLTARNLPVSIADIRKALETDEHLNNIPLSFWDNRALAARSQISKASVMSGDSGFSLSNGVCALKALAKHLANEAKG